MMQSASSPDRLAPRQVESAPLHVRACLCSTASILALATAALCSSVEPVRAACTPTVAPTTGQTVTCDTNAPNPVTTAIVSQPGSTNVTINMLSGAHDRVSDPTLLPVFQALPGAGSFIVNGATPAKNSALTSAGTELRLANGVTLLAKFDGEFASHSTTYAGTGTFRYRW